MNRRILLDRAFQGLIWLAYSSSETFSTKAYASQESNNPLSERTDSECSEYVIKRLTDSGYDQSTALAVSEINRRYLSILFDSNMQELDEYLSILARVGNHEKAKATIKRQPQMASLIAGAMSGNGSINKLLDTINSEYFEEYEKLYEFAATPEERIKLAEVLAKDGELIARFRIKQNVIDPVSWFLSVPTDPIAAMEYQKWVRNVLTDAVNNDTRIETQSDTTITEAEDVPYSAIDDAQSLLAFHSTKIRDLLSKDARFRERFFNSYWPKFREITSRHSDNDIEWGSHSTDNRFWDYCNQFGDSPWFDAYALFDQYGSSAIDLFVNTGYQHPAIQKVILEAFRLGDKTVIYGMSDPQLKVNHEFHYLLKRDLAYGTIQRAINDILQNPTMNRIDYFNRLSNKALTAELGDEPDGVITWVPGYMVYRLGEKLYQGREATTVDVILAGLDGGITLVSLGSGSSITSTVKGKVARSFANMGLKASAGEVAKRTTAELSPWIIRELIHASRIAMKRLATATTIDITHATQLVFQKSGLGRETFKKLTGLEARVFMRQDRRVAFSISNELSENAALRVALRETAENAGFDLAASSEPGKAVIKEGVKVGTEAFKAGSEALEVAKRQRDSWREHISIWWLATSHPDFYSLAK